jgi:hypothetical protein
MPRPLLATVAALLLSAVLAACLDRESPSPPPRVPKPKVQHQPVDPLKTGPVQERRTLQV